MRSKEEALALARRAVEGVPKGEAQALFQSERVERTRYAENRVVGHSADERHTLHLRVALDGGESAGSTTLLDDASLRGLAAHVSSLARAAPSGPPTPLLGPQTYEATRPFVATTALWGPRERSAAVEAIGQAAEMHGLLASGSYSVGVRQTTVVNSKGLEAHEAGTLAGLTALARGDTSSGYGDGYSRDASQLEPYGVAEQAVSKAILGLDPVPIEPGEYDVVLEQNAVAQLLACLARQGCGAVAVREGSSFMSGRLGERVTSELLTLIEDPTSPDALHTAVDAEGAPRRRVPLLENGVACRPVHDLRTAAQEGRESTGHAVYPRWTNHLHGPQPCSLFMGHGDLDLEELIGATRRGVLVSRFGALSVWDARSTLVGGVACDGVFLIEGGVLTRSLRPASFVVGILQALSGLELLGRERKLIVLPGPLAVVAPSLKLRGFRFWG